MKNFEVELEIENWDDLVLIIKYALEILDERYSPVIVCTGGDLFKLEIKFKAENNASFLSIVEYIIDTHGGPYIINTTSN